MGKFTLEVDFDGTLHGPAYRAVIGKALDDARSVVRTSAKMQDEIKTPVAHQPDPVVVGRWRIEL